jgi:NADPH:quinone reductase
MRHIEVTRFGGPEVLVPTTSPDPVAGPGEAVIAVAAADVLFLDTVIRSGRAGAWFPISPPYVPGNGVAGEVVALGPGLDPSWSGARVVARTGGAGGSGGYAEQVVVPLDRAVRVPTNLELTESAALLHDGSTALQLASTAAIKPEDHVLVLAAAGGLGILLVQLAQAAGAHVVGAARGTAKLDVVQRHGATAVDYSRDGWTARVLDATDGVGPDVVFDGAGGQLGREAFEITADGGRFSAHGAPGGTFAPIGPRDAASRNVSLSGIEHVQLDEAQHSRLVATVLGEASAGRLHPHVGQTFPLGRAADAHAAIEQRAVTGKTLLIPG